MALCIPFVVGPISELSTAIRVRGQLAGAQVTVFAVPGLKRVAVGVALSGDQLLNLSPGVRLSHDEVLVAVQEFGGEISDFPASDVGMGVQQGPQTAADLGVVGMATHLYECGRFVWVTGAVPGATVNVFANGTSIGSGPATEGFARLALAVGIPRGEFLAAHQAAALPSGAVAAGADFLALPGPPPVAPNAGLPLPAPTIALPLRQCDQAILISGVVDGALVTVHRSSGVPDEAAGFEVSSLWFSLQKALAEGEEVTVKQDLYERCELFGAWSKPVAVGPLGPVDPPVISQPLCNGMRRITLQGLRPGANVFITANGDVYRGTAPLDQTVGSFGVPALSSDTVSATQEVCGVASAPAGPAPVDDHPERIPPAVLRGPLFECATTVSVTGIHPGAELQVFATNRDTGGQNPISNRVSVFEPLAVLDVSPFLRASDDVTVAQWACAETRADSKAEPVKAHGLPNPPRIVDALRAGDTAVLLWDVLPGTTVTVYARKNSAVNYHEIGRANGNALFASLAVPLTGPLQAGDLVSARQRLCDISDIRLPVVVGTLPGFGPRPFYAVAHNPNTIQDVKNALQDGANAIEPDVNVYEDDDSRLCISDDEGEAGTVSLQQYLTELHHVAVQDKRLALVVFDCKAKTATPEHGLTLLTAIRNLLTFDTGLNVIISVSDFGSAGIFRHIHHLVGPREGLMLDEENDPVAVSNLFQQLGVVNQTFGNGAPRLGKPDEGPNVRPSMEQACALRAAQGRLKFIYVWTVNNEPLKQELIRIGVDGIISDSIIRLRDRMQEPEFQNVIRLANRVDNPLRPANFAYSLAVHTADRDGAGTDANVTFIVVGTKGSASKTVDTAFDFRMERNQWNFVTLASQDLGDLLSVTVQQDGEGSRPDWFLDKIEVQSARFGVLKTATFNQNIDSASPFTAPLV